MAQHQTPLLCQSVQPSICILGGLVAGPAKGIHIHGFSGPIVSPVTWVLHPGLQPIEDGKCRIWPVMVEFVDLEGRLCAVDPWTTWVWTARVQFCVHFFQDMGTVQSEVVESEGAEPQLWRNCVDGGPVVELDAEFWLHPSSPCHSRVNFVVSFTKVEPLKFHFLVCKLALLTVRKCINPPREVRISVWCWGNWLLDLWCWFSLLELSRLLPLPGPVEAHEASWNPRVAGPL